MLWICSRDSLEQVWKVWDQLGLNWSNYEFLKLLPARNRNSGCASGIPDGGPEFPRTGIPVGQPVYRLGKIQGP